jgi:predicted RNA-binding Zn-ribbon protein involved in translation (DUF1610 family)
MTRRKHVETLAAIVESALDAQEVPGARRLLEVELAWVVSCARGNEGEALHLRRLIEVCRDRHLMPLDPDDGLTVLGIDWEEVALAVRRRARERSPRARRRCGRCGEAMELRVAKERSVPSAYRCPGCGLVIRAGRRS